MKTMKIAPSFLFSTFLLMVLLLSAGTPVLAAADAVPMVQADPGGTVTPPSTSIELKPGESQSISFTLTTAELPPQKVDILFLFDVTGSMSDVLQEAKDNGVDVMQSLEGIYEDIAFGVASFADFVTSYKYGGTEREYGVKGDYPWRLDLDITSDTERAIAQITSLKKLNGGDEPESTLTALWQSAGIGWRDGSRRVIALFTDAHVHDPEFYQEAGGGDYGPDPGPDAVFGTADDLDMWTTIDYLAEQGVAVFTVYYTSKPKDDVQFGFEQLAEGTGGGVFNLEEASDLTRVLVDELGSSIRSVGILEALVSAENTTDLEIRVSPGRYETVASGDDRDFNVQVTAAEKISKAGKSIVKVDFLADGNLTTSAEITVTLKRNFSWWWVIVPCLCLLAIILVAAAVFLIRWFMKRRAEVE